MDDFSQQPARDRRCPYCHDDLAVEEASACGECGVAHHPTCFSEHGGCSVYGCGSQHGNTGEAPELSWGDQLLVGAIQGAAAGQAGGQGANLRFCLQSLRGVLECRACRRGVGDERLVARCSVCGAVQHAQCYEESAGCVQEACRVAGFRVDLIAQRQVRRANRRLAARILRFSGLFFLPLAAYLLVFAGHPVALLLATLLTIPAVLGQLLLARSGAEPVETVISPDAPLSEPSRQATKKRLKQ